MDGICIMANVMVSFYDFWCMFNAISIHLDNAITKHQYSLGQENVM